MSDPTPPPRPTATALIPARYASTRFPGKPLAHDTGKPLIQHVVERLAACETLALIPARFASTRFPGKPLAADTGKPLIQHVVERLAHCETLDRVVVATDDALVVNVQGDEPEIPPKTVDALVRGLSADSGADMATLAATFGPGEDTTDPNVVKLVLTRTNRALYFSRSPIPFDRDGTGGITVYKHPGLYAYRKPFLDRYATLAPTPLERAEKLEQLRVLEHGFQIAVIHAEAPHPGIDTPEQYAAFVARQRSGQVAE